MTVFVVVLCTVAAALTMTVARRTRGAQSIAFALLALANAGAAIVNAAIAVGAL